MGKFLLRFMPNSVGYVSNCKDSDKRWLWSDLERTTTTMRGGCNTWMCHCVKREEYRRQPSFTREKKKMEWKIPNVMTSVTTKTMTWLSEDGNALKEFLTKMVLVETGKKGRWGLPHTRENKIKTSRERKRKRKK